MLKPAFNKELCTLRGYLGPPPYEAKNQQFCLTSLLEQ